MTFEEVWQYTDKIGGYYEKPEAELLHRAACEVPEGGLMVEIGTFQGRSSSVLLQVAQTRRVRVGLIDPFAWMGKNAESELLKTLEPFRDVRYLFWKRYGHEVAPEYNFGIDLIHVDGNHQEDGIRQDCELWLPKLKPGGIACFHDYDRRGPDGIEEVFPGIKRVVDELTGDWEHFGLAGTLCARRKPFEITEKAA